VGIKIYVLSGCIQVFKLEELFRPSALRLGKYFGMEPEFWLNLQMRYNMKIARSKVGKKIEKEVKVCCAQTEVNGLVTA